MGLILLYYITTSSNGNISTLLALCAGNSPVTGEFPAQRPVTLSFGVFFDLHLNKRLSKLLWDWLFQTPLRSLWSHCNDPKINLVVAMGTINQSLWFWSQNIFEELSRCHSRWCPDLLHCQGISSHSIDYVVKSLSSVQKDFNYLLHLHVQEWYKIQLYIDVSPPNI